MCESGAVVPLLTGAAAPGRPRIASHEAFPKAVKFGGRSPPQMTWKIRGSGSQSLPGRPHQWWVEGRGGGRVNHKDGTRLTDGSCTSRHLVVFCGVVLSVLRERIREGWGAISSGDYFAGENFGRENFATLANPKAHTASRTRCTAKAPRLHQGKIAPPSLKTKISHEIIRPLYLGRGGVSAKVERLFCDSLLPPVSFSLLLPSATRGWKPSPLISACESSCENRTFQCFPVRTSCSSKQGDSS